MDFYNFAVTEGEGVTDYSGLTDANTQNVGQISTGTHKNTWHDCAQRLAGHTLEPDKEDNDRLGLLKQQWRRLADCTVRRGGVPIILLFSIRF